MAKADAGWREYAKVRQEGGRGWRDPSGPMQGEWAHCKWVDPEPLSHKAGHIAFIVGRAEEQSGPAPSLPPGTAVG